MADENADAKRVEELTLCDKVSAHMKKLWGRIPDGLKNDKDIKFEIAADDVFGFDTADNVSLDIMLGGFNVGSLNLYNIWDYADSCPGPYNSDTKSGFYCPDGKGGIFDDKDNKERIQICPHTAKCAKVQAFLREYEQKYLEKPKK